MNASDHEPIVTIAYLAATADGKTSPEEQSQLRSALGRLGLANLGAPEKLATERPRLRDVAARLSDRDARFLAYETALVVCHADGPMNDHEVGFLAELRDVLGLDQAATGKMDREAASLAGDSSAIAAPAGKPASDSEVDQQILRQAMLTAAVELLPDKLANVVILPLQLRLVHQIGQRHGQKLDANQIKDLAGTLGLGAAARAVEGVVRKLVGGVAGGLFGGLIGGAGGLAAGAAVTFASTYALGHVANQYYAQGRRLSSADLRELFKRFQEDAKTIFPKMQDEIQAQAKRLNLGNLLKEIG